MGLTERHLKKFQSSRIYTTILFENLPQLAIQLWYIAYVYERSNDNDDIVILASISSFVSIFIAWIDVWSSMFIEAVTNILLFLFCVEMFCGDRLVSVFNIIPYKGLLQSQKID